MRELIGLPRAYEDFYCARGDMENRIKEQQLDLFADRTSTHWMASNQLRLWFSARPFNDQHPARLGATRHRAGACFHWPDPAAAL